MFCLLISTCQASDTDTKKPEEITTVRTTVLETGTLVRRLGYSGDVEGEAEIRVFSPIPDRIVSVKVREGDSVKVGHVLAVIRSSGLTQGVLQASGGLDAALARRSAIEDQLTRLRALQGSGAVSSSQLQTLQSELAAAKAQVRQLEAMVGQARERKGDSIIRAPISGLIGQIFLKVGDLAAPGIPICTVVSMDRVKIKARVPESDLMELKTGQPVRYRVVATRADYRYGTVSRVSPVLDRLSRTAAIEVDVENADHLLKPGMLARIEVEVERKENALWVPRDGITVTAKMREDRSVYRAVVVESQKAVIKEVVVGLEDELRVEVLEGLKPGEELVIEGQHLLSEGDPVKLVGRDQKKTSEKRSLEQAKPVSPEGRDPS